MDALKAFTALQNPLCSDYFSQMLNYLREPKTEPKCCFFKLHTINTYMKEKIHKCF